MNVLEVMMDGFKRLYSGKSVCIKHSVLLILTGIVSLVSKMCSDYSTAIKEGGTVPDNLALLGIGTVVSLIICVYLGGYTLKYIHNIFESAGDSLLPAFEASSFGVFFKALPMLLLWVLYLIVGVLVLAFLLPKVFVLPLFLIMAILFAIVINFLFIEFSKNFEAKGLYGLPAAMKYLTSKILGYYMLFGILFIPVNIILLIIAVILGVVLMTTHIAGPNSTYSLLYILYGYASFVIQYVWYYCITQVYREQIDSDLAY